MPAVKYEKLSDDRLGKPSAVIAWNDTTQKSHGQVEAYFRLQPSPYTGWDVVQTSLLDDLLSYYHNASIGT